MAKKSVSLLAAAAIVAGAAVSSAAEPTAAEIIARHIEARGGEEAIREVETARIVGTMSVTGMEVPVTILWKRPDKIRMDLVVGGEPGVQAYDGTTGWAHMPFLGRTEPAIVPREALEQVREQADLIEGELFDWEAKGYRVEYLGKSELEGSEAYRIEVTRDDGGVRNVHFIDPDSYLEIATESTRTIEGREVAMIATLGNFQRVEGLVFPFSIELEPKGAPPGTPGQTIVIHSMELDRPVDESLFSFPGGAASADEAPKGEADDVPDGA